MTIVSGNFTFFDTPISGVKVVESKVYGDERGYFTETYKNSDFIVGGIDAHFVQDNQSSSTRGVLRGLHYQKRFPQAKLVRVLKGEVFDVAVDIRPSSETFASWYGLRLSRENGKQLFIPKGLAHGFLVLSDTAEFAYKCDEEYHPEDEAGLAWNDPTIDIVWPEFSGDFILSEKDKNYASFDELFKG